MARETYVMRDGKLVPKSQAAPLLPPAKRSALPMPYFVRDEIPPTFHPATGQLMTSLSEFRKVTKASGCEEVGNEALPAYRPPPVESMEKVVAEAWDIVEQGGFQECREQDSDLAAQPLTILQQPGTKPKEAAEVQKAAQMLGASTREAGELPQAKATPAE